MFFPLHNQLIFFNKTFSSGGRKQTFSFIANCQALSLVSSPIG
ncbi:hypothetical protein SPAR10_1161 [Streptococcus infantis SPAR10]|uniref:Uncharacterized protein n=1 Tax=Streptococcus infantis SPAR10 TaxID=1159208 RepID=J1GXT7_9STRE|nr:hypothetical protein SPAR10_1161 [Streptococcus infantis SPAR10]